MADLQYYRPEGSLTNRELIIEWRRLNESAPIAYDREADSAPPAKPRIHREGVFGSIAGAVRQAVGGAGKVASKVGQVAAGVGKEGLAVTKDLAGDLAGGAAKAVADTPVPAPSAEPAEPEEPSDPDRSAQASQPPKSTAANPAVKRQGMFKAFANSFRRGFNSARRSGASEPAEPDYPMEAAPVYPATPAPVMAGAPPVKPRIRRPGALGSMIGAVRQAVGGMPRPASPGPSQPASPAGSAPARPVPRAAPPLPMTGPAVAMSNGSTPKPGIAPALASVPGAAKPVTGQVAPPRQLMAPAPPATIKRKKPYANHNWR